MDSDQEELYDEFGNLIGEAEDSGAESSSGDEVPIPNFESSDEEDGTQQGTNGQEIVLHEDKKLYPSIVETFGEDVEMVVATEDAQDIDTPLVEPVERHVFQIQESDLPETTYSKEYMLELSRIPDRVRNVAIAGGLHCGKTTFVDLLVKQTHPGLADRQDLRYTDSHNLEHDKGLSLKSVPITLLLPDLQSKSVVVNLIDTPGHISFLDETAIALATADACVLCIDVVEGLTRADELILEHCIANDVPISVLLNKVDRLILELRLPPTDAYFKLRHVLDEINAFIATTLESSTAYSHETRMSPEMGNVCFASGYYQFCFSLTSFVAAIYGDTGDNEAFSMRLWGDIFYTSTGTFTTKRSASDQRSFIKFVLEPLYKIFTNSLVKTGKELSSFYSRHFGLKFPKSMDTLDSRTLLMKALGQIFRESAGFVDMLGRLPSPAQSAAKLAKQLTSGNTAATRELIERCDSEAPLLAHVTKLIDTADSKRFYGLVRVLSGTLKVGGEGYTVLGANYHNDDEDAIHSEQMTKLYVNAARYKIAVESVPCGNVALVMSENLDSFLTKSGTIVAGRGADLAKMATFAPLKTIVRPFLKVAVEPQKPSELHKLLEGFRKVNRAYTSCEIKVEESGEHVVVGTGELYLDCLLHDLRKLYTEIEIKISDPLTKFSETCLDASKTKIAVKSANGLNEISIVVEPLETQIQRDIAEERVSLDRLTPRKLAKWFREIYGWDSLASRSIWSFGADPAYPNVLLDDTLPDEVDKDRLLALKNFIVQGFQWAAREGPLCGEPVRDLKFKIVDMKLADDLLDSNGGQIIPMVRNACYTAMLLSSPALLEPVYQVDVVVKIAGGAEGVADGLRELFHKRRGHIVADSVVPATQLYKYRCHVPVLDSTGLETDIRVRTQGQAMCFLSMSHWDTVPGDPMDSTVFLPPLKPVPHKSLARDCVLKTRKRKGIAGEPGLSKYIDAQLLHDLKENGIIDDVL